MIEAKAYTQVSHIISLMSNSLKEKIPQDFIDMIERNKDKNYEIKEENVKDMVLLSDTEKILSVIYTDYIASEEEKVIIKNKEKMLYLKEENKEKYNINVFKNIESSKKTKNENISMIPKIEKRWYQKIFEKIRKLLSL